jgi:hypothetical protein
VSIITIRSMFEKRGCQVVLGAVAVLLGVGLIFPMLNLGGPGMPGQEQERTLMTVAGQKVTVGELDALARNRPPSATDPTGRLSEIGMMLDELVNRATLSRLAAKYQVKLTDDQIKTFALQQVDQSMMLARFQLQMNKSIEANATDKQFEEAYKKATGTTPTEAKANAEKNIADSLKDAKKREELEKQFLREGITTAIAARMNMSEADVKNTFDTFFLNRMAFAQPNKSAEARKADAEKAIAELKSGKSFADVHKALLGQPAAPPTEMTRGMLESDPANAPILTLKPNEVSPVIESFGTPTVYQLVKVETKLPPDFEKNKAQLVKSLRQQKASEALQKELTDATKGAAIKWEEPTLGIVYQSYLAVSSQRQGKTKKDFEALLAKIEPAFSEAPSDNLAMAQHVIFEEIFRLSTSDQQAEMKERRADVITATLDYLESHTLRMELAAIYQELGNKEQTFVELEAAARNATGGFEQENQAQITALETKAFSLERSKFLTKEQGDQLRKIIVQWRDEKKRYDEEQKELERLAAEEQKKLDEEEKKMMEEEKKLMEKEKKEAASKAAAPPAASPSTPPAKP